MSFLVTRKMLDAGHDFARPYCGPVDDKYLTDLYSAMARASEHASPRGACIPSPSDLVLWLHHRHDDHWGRLPNTHGRAKTRDRSTQELYGNRLHCRKGDSETRSHRRKPEAAEAPTWIDTNLAAAAAEKHTQRDSSVRTVVSRADIGSGERKYGRRAYDK